MKRMNKEMAENAAEELAKIAFDKKIKEAKMALKDFGDTLAKKYFPAPLIACFKEYGKYFNSQHEIAIHSPEERFDNKYIFTNMEIPSQTFYPTVEKDEWKMAVRLKNNYNNLLNSRNNYVEKVTQALFTLKTHNKIKESFPEALPFINFTEETLPAANYTALRDLLK